MHFKLTFCSCISTCCLQRTVRTHHGVSDEEICAPATAIRRMCSNDFSTEDTSETRPTSLHPLFSRDSCTERHAEQQFLQNDSLKTSASSVSGYLQCQRCAGAKDHREDLLIEQVISGKFDSSEQFCANRTFPSRVKVSARGVG